MSTAAASTTGPRYLQPGWFTKNVFNRIVVGLTRLGVSVRGSPGVLWGGRTSRGWRRTPVNLLEHGGRRYLVAPRGRTQWVRNLEAAGSGAVAGGRARGGFIT